LSQKKVHTKRPGQGSSGVKLPFTVQPHYKNDVKLTKFRWPSTEGPSKTDGYINAMKSII
jgi:hypothetical protein